MLEKEYAHANQVAFRKWGRGHAAFTILILAWAFLRMHVGSAGILKFHSAQTGPRHGLWKQLCA